MCSCDLSLSLFSCARRAQHIAPRRAARALSLSAQQHARPRGDTPVEGNPLAEGLARLDAVPSVEDLPKTAGVLPLAGMEAGVGSNPPCATPRERVLLCLAGTLEEADAASLGDFLHALTGFRPASLQMEPHRLARVLIEGVGAHRACAEATGVRSDAGRQFEQLMMHVEWFCPCGASGDAPLRSIDLCANCGNSKPQDLREAAEDAEWFAAQRAALQPQPQPQPQQQLQQQHQHLG